MRHAHVEKETVFGFARPARNEMAIKRSGIGIAVSNKMWKRFRVYFKADIFDTIPMVR